MESAKRLIAVLFSPVKTFDSIAQRPTWAVALAVLVAVGVVSWAVTSPRVDMEQVIIESMERQGREATSEQLEGATGSQTGVALIMVLVSGPVLYLLIAVALWVAFRLLGGGASYRQSFSVTVHSFLPWAVSELLSVPAILARDSLTLEELESGVLPSHLGVLTDADASRVVDTLLTSINLFTIWTLVLMVIGFAAANKISRRKAAVTVVLLWLVYVAARVGLASIWG